MSDTTREQACDRMDYNIRLMQAMQARQLEAPDQPRHELPATWQLSAAAR